MAIRVTHVSHYDGFYGAAIATQRIHQSLLRHGPHHGIESFLRTIESNGVNDACISSPPLPLPLHRRLLDRLATRLLHAPHYRGFETTNPVYKSLAWHDTGLGRELNRSSADVLQLHWLGADTLSISEIGRLRKPVIMTLHDQWAFCGAEHYVNLPPLEDRRYALSYSPASRPPNERGPDLNRHVWLLKRLAWVKPMHIACPSRWMADCVRTSSLMGSWPIHVIPYPINLEQFAPRETLFARHSLDLPHDQPLILFGAYGGTIDLRKGADLLLEALKRLRNRLASLKAAMPTLVVFGQDAPANPIDYGFPVHYRGRIDDEDLLSLYYTATDMMVVPSRLDNLPNTAIEAQACGTPVVAFRIGGLSDIINDGETGRLAEPYDPESLAEAMAWVLEDKQRMLGLRVSARQRAERLWSPERIAGMHADMYSEVLDSDVARRKP